MKAKVIVGLAGVPSRDIGEIVEGAEAIRLIEVGYAVPVVEEVKVEKAVRSSPRKEIR